MDIVAKIDYLRKQNGWSIYKLAEMSNLTQSTLANMFTRHSVPSIATLSQICSAFNITLSEFFSKNDNLCDDEKLLVGKFRKLDLKDRNKIIKIIDIIGDFEINTRPK